MKSLKTGLFISFHFRNSLLGLTGPKSTTPQQCGLLCRGVFEERFLQEVTDDHLQLAQSLTVCQRQTRLAGA
jgi:hypothetical protein